MGVCWVVLWPVFVLVVIQVAAAFLDFGVERAWASLSMLGAWGCRVQSDGEYCVKGRREGRENVDMCSGIRTIM